MNADENRIEYCFRCLSKSTHRLSVQHVFLFTIMDFFLVFCFGGGAICFFLWYLKQVCICSNVCLYADIFYKALVLLLALNGIL